MTSTCWGLGTVYFTFLLFSSGIYCRDSPLFDDLFGFSVDDVMKEVKRGSKLLCNKCKKKGATVGCEVGRCKKSYHYPCAIEAGAKPDEDPDIEKYVLYCLKHYEQRQNNEGSVNGRTSSAVNPGTSKDPSEAGTSKVFCLTCEKKEGNISLDSVNNSIVMSYCDKHAPSSLKRNTNGDSSAAGPSGCSGDSNSSSSTTRLSSKRQLSVDDKQEESPSKRKTKTCKRRVLNDSSDSADENEARADMAMFAPLESDLDESANSVPESQLISDSKDTQSPTGSTSGNRLEDESRDGNEDEDETIIHSDAESESLLLPVEICVESHSLSATSVELQTESCASAAHPHAIEAEVIVVEKTEDKGSDSEQSPVHSPDRHTTGSPVPQQSSAEPPPSPDRTEPCTVTDPPPCTSSATSPAPPDTICTPLPSSPPSPAAPPVDSISFWKSCNVAGCTQAIFTDFINEMYDIAGRIQSDQASQEDCDRALAVMEASGKLAECVAKQQKELQRKQTELEKAAAAMKKVVSALKR